VSNHSSFLCVYIWDIYHVLNNTYQKRWTTLYKKIISYCTCVNNIISFFLQTTVLIWCEKNKNYLSNNKLCMYKINKNCVLLLYTLLFTTKNTKLKKKKIFFSFCLDGKYRWVFSPLKFGHFLSQCSFFAFLKRKLLFFIVKWKKRKLSSGYIIFNGKNIYTLYKIHEQSFHFYSHEKESGLVFYIYFRDDFDWQLTTKKVFFCLS